MVTGRRNTLALLLSVALCRCGGSPTEGELDLTVSLVSPVPAAVLQNACMLDAVPMKVWDFDWSDVPTASRYHLFVTGQAPNPLIDVDDLTESSHHAEIIGYTKPNWKIQILKLEQVHFS